VITGAVALSAYLLSASRRGRCSKARPSRQRAADRVRLPGLSLLRRPLRIRHDLGRRELFARILKALASRAHSRHALLAVSVAQLGQGVVALAVMIAAGSSSAGGSRLSGSRRAWRRESGFSIIGTNARR